MRIAYRVRQFWRAVFVSKENNKLEQAQAQLTPAQWALFDQLQPAEQAHALRIYHLLVQQGDIQPDLLVAALLHDVGKLRYPMNAVERAVVVVIKKLAPGLAQGWAELPEAGWEGASDWRKAFILAEHHPAWGAELASKVGVSALSETLIRYHQHAPFQGFEDKNGSLQYKLCVADNDL